MEMKRYYLDTNMLVFILQRNNDNINATIENLLCDCSSILYTSSVAVSELILLYRIGKVNLKRYKSEQNIQDEMKNTYGIETVFFNARHLLGYSNLQISTGHKDMNDHAIIAQAISDKIPLISSDREFEKYTSQGLTFVLNKR
jgi:PIN domain nuclease of toxin-antitoxin system